MLVRVHTAGARKKLNQQLRHMTVVCLALCCPSLLVHCDAHRGCTSVILMLPALAIYAGLVYHAGLIYQYITIIITQLIM